MSERAEVLADHVGRLHQENGLLHAENVRLRSVLARIADGIRPPDYCTCGHKPEFCHKTNANRWCGGFEAWTVWEARDALESTEVVRRPATSETRGAV